MVIIEKREEKEVNDLKQILEILHKLRYIMNTKQRGQYICVTILSVIGSALELLGVAAVMPFIEAITDPKKVTSKWYYGIIENMFGHKEGLELVTFLAGVIIVIYLFKNLFLILSSYIQCAFAAGVQRDLSIKMTDIFMHSSYLFHLGINSSVLIRIVNQDVIGVFSCFYYMFRMLGEMFTIFAIIIYIVLLDPFMAISLAIILGACMSILLVCIKQIIRRAGKQSQDCESLMLQYLRQAFTGIKEIMVMNRQDHFARNFNDTCVTYGKITKKYNFLNSIPMYIYEAICIGGLVGVVTMRLNMTDDITGFVAKLSVVAVAAFRLFPSVGRLTTNVNALNYYKARLDAVYDMIKDLKGNSEAKSGYGVSDAEPLAFDNELKVSDVTWKYPTGQDYVFKGLNLTIKKGKSIALIGASGAGKTTLADVILGLLKPESGKVTLDGVDIYDNLPGWAKVIGYVPQSIYLTDDTIRNNVAFGIDENKIDDEKIWNALKEAQLAEFVEGLSEGLDTMVGEAGVRLSGGQRQRIGIARALYENPAILVLDEATSALDNETETAVMEAIDSLHGSKTMIIVAHRLTTIRNCDEIYEIGDGKAVLRDKDEVTH